MALRVVIAAVFLFSTSVIATAHAQVGQTEPKAQNEAAAAAKRKAKHPRHLR